MSARDQKRQKTLAAIPAQIVPPCPETLSRGLFSCRRWSRPLTDQRKRHAIGSGANPASCPLWVGTQTSARAGLIVVPGTTDRRPGMAPRPLWMNLPRCVNCFTCAAQRLSYPRQAGFMSGLLGGSVQWRRSPVIARWRRSAAIVHEWWARTLKPGARGRRCFRGWLPPKAVRRTNPSTKKNPQPPTISLRCLASAHRVQSSLHGGQRPDCSSAGKISSCRFFKFARSCGGSWS